MPTVYIDGALGSDAYSYAQAQSALTPWATIEKAIASASAADTVSIVGGTYTAATNFMSFTKTLLSVAQVANAVTWRAFPAYATYVARTSSSAGAGTFTFNGINFDCENVAATGFEIGADDTDLWTVNITDCATILPKQRGINLFNRIGTVNITGYSCSFTGSTAGTCAGIITSNLDAGAVAGNPVAFNITDSTISVTPTSGQVGAGVYIGAASTRLNTVTNTVTGNTISVTANNASLACVWLYGGDSAVVQDNEITVSSLVANGDCYGIRVLGRSATATSNNAVISGNTIRSAAPAGYAIALGDSVSATNNMTGGEVSGNRVSGQYFSASTPHNIVLGQGTTGAAIGNLTTDSYVGLMASLTTTASIRGNIARDCYGPSFYAKGTTAATFSGNTAVVRGKYTQRDTGILGVTYQGSTNCTAVTFSNNTVICTDVSRIHSLASITGLAATSGTPQPATFTGNTYYIPDAVDLSSALLFQYTGVIGAAANYTYAQWIAVNTTDKIIQLPVNILKQLAANPDFVIIPGTGLVRTIGQIPL